MHSKVGGSQAVHFAIDRDFDVLERSLRFYTGNLRGRHSSQNIAKAIQLPGHDATRLDDDACVDLDAWEAALEAARALLLAASWGDTTSRIQREIGIVVFPISSDDEIDEEANDKSSDDGKDIRKRLHCSQCKIFDHEYGKECRMYKHPPPPKRRIDEEYHVTDAFYESVVHRYLKPSADCRGELLRWGTGEPCAPNYATAKRPPGVIRKRGSGHLGPSLATIMSDDKRKWLATHAPLPKFSGIVNSR